jgi:hypothetical protein
VPEAVYLPIVGPLILGNLDVDIHQRPVPGSSLKLRALVNDVGSSVRLPIGEVPGVEVGDRLVLENLDKGTSAWAIVSERGTVRVAVGADALGPIERRSILGLDAKGPNGEPAPAPPIAFADTPALGDRLRLTIYKGSTALVRAVFDSFGADLAFQGTTYPAGAPLVALQEGLGYRRNTPELRRFLGIAQHALDAADPATWSVTVGLEPLDTRYDPNWEPSWERGRTRALIMPTAGDMNVPVNTAISEARITGAYGSWLRDETVDARYGWRRLFEPDARYGHSMDHELVSRYVYESIERLERYRVSHPNLIHPAVLYDIDDLGEGRSEWSCFRSENGDERYEGDWEDFECPGENAGKKVWFKAPTAEKPMRAGRDRGDGTSDAVRIPMLRPRGQHGIYNAQAFRAFDMDTAMVNLTTLFLGSRGRVTEVDGCDCSASRIADWQLAGNHYDVAQPVGGAPCEETDLKVCSTACSNRLGLETPERSACNPP